MGWAAREGGAGMGGWGRGFTEEADHAGTGNTSEGSRPGFWQRCDRFKQSPAETLAYLGTHT